MLSKWSFSLPTRIEFGRGRVRQIGRFVLELVSQGITAEGGCATRSVLLVGYGDCAALDTAYAAAVDSLRAVGLRVEEFMEVVPEPDEEIAVRGAEVARRLGSGVVLGLGGGSVIDTAKGIAALAVNEAPLWEHSTANPQSRPIGQALPIVAIPTTAGTGAEATSVAVFEQHGVGPTPHEPLKAIVHGPALAPALAIVDPAFMDTMPADVAAACGADALSHSIEVITSRLANPVCTALAVESVRLSIQNLATAIGCKEATNPKETKKSRAALTLATTLSGIAVNGPGVTAAHAAAHALGALLHVPHGQAVSLTALPFLRFNKEACIEPYANLARACGLANDGMTRPGAEEELAGRFVERVDELWQTLGLPRRLEQSNPAECDGLVKRLAQNTIDGTPLPLRNNARKVDGEALEGIFAGFVNPIVTRSSPALPHQ